MVNALIDSNSNINAMTPAYMAKIGLIVGSNNIGTQIIDGSDLMIYRMVTQGYAPSISLKKKIDFLRRLFW